MYYICCNKLIDWQSILISSWKCDWYMSWYAGLYYISVDVEYFNFIQIYCICPFSFTINNICTYVCNRCYFLIIFVLISKSQVNSIPNIDIECQSTVLVYAKSLHYSTSATTGQWRPRGRYACLTAGKTFWSSYSTTGVRSWRGFGVNGDQEAHLYMTIEIQQTIAYCLACV